MTDAGFVQDILAHPEDDAPRLVYADWLEELTELDPDGCNWGPHANKLLQRFQDRGIKLRP